MKFRTLDLLLAMAIVAAVCIYIHHRKMQQSLNSELANAVHAANWKRVKELVKLGADPNLRYDLGGENLLHSCVRSGDVVFIEELLGLGLDPNGTKSLKDQTAIESLENSDVADNPILLQTIRDLLVSKGAKEKRKNK